MSDNKPRIGFIGLGLMGQAFTQRLTDCGYTVTGYDLEAAKIKQAEQHGVVPANSPAEVATNSDIIMTCVTSTQCVEDVVFGDKGVANAGAAGSILVDFSTTIVENTRAMAARLREDANMGWIDAPVSGGPEAAGSGGLAIMAGGDAADVAKVAAVMDQLSATFTLFGPAGSGQVAKMVNQVLVLNNYVVISEALALAEAGGIDASKIPAALAPGHAGSNLLTSMFPRLIARDFEPRGYARQILKDLDMLHDLAKQLKTPTPMSSQSASLYRILNSKGHEELDGIAIFKMFDQEDTV
jgi:3-hydroxyisobutyrate dehydrogenase-like beta-hydroxyacid dehydrogenase